MRPRNKPTLKDIIAAHDRIRPFVTATPVITNTVIDEAAGCNIFFKCENLQEIGAFKARGATNAVISLPEEHRKYGVATHSSGNHGQAVARAAKLVGIKSYIVMPRSAPDIKRKGVKFYGGNIIDCQPSLASRESTLAAVIQRTGAIEIHPFNNYDVIAGQATAAKELLETAGHMDFIVAPVGGGGLISGTALIAKYTSPATAVIGAEPAGADDAFRSLSSGIIENSQGDSIAEGLLASLGDKTFEIIKSNVARIITVTDEEIVSAMKMLWEELKVVVEPSGAVGLAALVKERTKFRAAKVGLILSGGNVDLNRAFALFASNQIE